MASLTETNSASNDQSLKSLFHEGLRLFENIEESREATNSTETQAIVKRAIKHFEDATRLVSVCALFSRNESVEEIPTETLQYLLLPALLGTLTLKICNQNRKEIIEVAEIYFKDFLQRCHDYGVADFSMPTASHNEECDTVQPRNDNTMNKITQMVLSRENKIKRYKESKELKEKLTSLKKSLDSANVDDQTKRQYYHTLILDYVNQSLDELNSIEAEKPIIDYMERRVKDGLPVENNGKPNPPKLKPIIITRDAVQKAVYGLGYPSVPTVTIEEFYQNRVKEGIFPPGNSAGSSRLPTTTIESTECKNGEDSEEIQKETLIETDNIEELARIRAFDEYKDTHKRGWGNRHNRS